MADPMQYESPIYTPDTEPYLGRASVHALDNMIVVVLALNSEIAPRTHHLKLSTIQAAACQLIPQSLSLALSIRELIRQGYLFGAIVLGRPLLERLVILLYLKAKPEAERFWGRGWRHDEAPSLARMLDSIVGDGSPGLGRDVTAPLNAIIHGKPDSALWTMIPLPDGTFGHGVSKILNSPGMCDKISVETTSILSLVMTLMLDLFPTSDVA